MRGAWLALLVKHATLDLGVVSLSPTSEVEPTFKKTKTKNQFNVGKVN